MSYNKMAAFDKVFGQLTAAQLAGEVTRLYGRVECCIIKTFGEGADSYSTGEFLLLVDFHFSTHACFASGE